MSTFVLVTGAWHDGSAWAPVINHLESQGHKAYGPTVAGLGKGADKNVGLAEATQSIVDYIVSHDLTDVVLVGHSWGGIVISLVAQAIPERIRRLVFWSAFVINDGESLYDNVPPNYQGLFDQLAQGSSDNTVMLPFPVFRGGFINDADDETAQRAYDQLSSHPYRTMTDKADLKKFYELINSGKIPTSYLLCTEDVALPPGEWGWHPRMSSRLGNYRHVEMPGSHEVIFTNPTGLADKLIEAGRD